MNCQTDGSSSPSCSPVTVFACRILPAALAYLLFLEVLGLLGFIAVDRREFWAALFFWRNYLPPAWIHRGSGGSTIHYWSLAVEEHFYLIWPALLVLSGKRKARVLAVALALVVAAWRWWDFHHQWIATLLPGVLFAGRTDVRLDGLLLGCAVALWLDERNSTACALSAMPCSRNASTCPAT